MRAAGLGAAANESANMQYEHKLLPTTAGAPHPNPLLTKTDLPECACTRASPISFSSPHLAARPVPTPRFLGCRDCLLSGRRLELELSGRGESRDAGNPKLRPAPRWVRPRLRARLIRGCRNQAAADERGTAEALEVPNIGTARRCVNQAAIMAGSRVAIWQTKLAMMPNLHLRQDASGQVANCNLLTS